MPAFVPVKPWPRYNRLLALVGLAGVAEFVVAVIALHAASMPNEPWHMSEFANTRYTILWALALYGFAIGGTAITLALKPRLSSSRSQRAGLWMLWIAGIGAMLLAVCPVDKDADKPTMAGTIHEDVGPPTFMLSGAAMVVLVPAFRANASWRAFAGPSLAIGVLVTASAVWYVICTEHQNPWAFLSQRILVGLICTWFILLAARLLKVRPQPEVVPRASVVKRLA